MAFETINSFTGELIQKYQEWTREKTLTVLEKVNQAWPYWVSKTFFERSAILFPTAEVLRQDKEQLARMMTLEMGKPISEGRGEIKKCATVCYYYAEKAESFLAPEVIESDATRSCVAFRPLGTVLAVMPWDFPFWQVFRFAAPGLMAGNTCVLKHSSNVPQCAQAIQKIFE